MQARGGLEYWEARVQQVQEMQFADEELYTIQQASATFPFRAIYKNVPVLIAKAPVEWLGDDVFQQQLLGLYDQPSQELDASLVRENASCSICCLLSA